MLEHIRIVMVETTHPGNIGAAARAMKTMGLSKLSLVKPKVFPDAEAYSRASGAIDILDNVQVHDSVAAALEGATLVVGTSARQRRIPWPCITSRQLAEQIHAEYRQQDADQTAEVAILFGRENSGLTNEELEHCNLHVTIPTNAKYGVLNVAAAIQIICYDLRMIFLDQQAADVSQHQMPQVALPWDEPLAKAEDVTRFFDHLERVIVNTGFLKAENADQVKRRLRRLFMRTRLDKNEVNILRGILTSIEKPHPPKVQTQKKES